MNLTIHQGWIFSLGLLAACLVACLSEGSVLQRPPTQVAQVATATPTPLPVPTSVPWTLTVEAAVPLAVKAAVDQQMTADPSFVAAPLGTVADVTITVNAGEPLGEWIYAVVVPFATVEDETTVSALQGGEPLLASAETAAALASLWPELPVTPIAAEELTAALWRARPAAAIVPFEALRPDLKVQTLDGLNPLLPTFDAADYPLRLRIGIVGEKAAVADWLAHWRPLQNRDPARLTTIAMTGVTALVRATAVQMETAGVLFPGEVVAPILQAADIAHISNEVPFAEDCPYPDGFSQSLVFCSRDQYFELLKAIGTDVVEVTGNHSNDYGRESMVRSLAMYEAAGMAYFGGGRNLAEAQRAALFEHNGNRIAFVGCNSVGPLFAWATLVEAGAAPCGDYGVITAEISRLKEAGYLVIATLQYQEEYDYWPTQQQQTDYVRLAQAGAAAVSGSQSHHPQGFAFADGTFIHYGLGNLFFDQMDSLGTRQLFIDQYVVYDGRLISVVLWTGLLEYYARPREMTAAERADLLRQVFLASGW